MVPSELTKSKALLRVTGEPFAAKVILHKAVHSYMLEWLPKVSNSDTYEFAIKSSQPTGMHFEKCHLIKKAGNHQDSGKKR